MATTKVTMKVRLSGTRDGQPWPNPGDTIALPSDEADHLCGLGLAEPAEVKTKTKAAPKGETATKTPKGEKG